MIKCDQKKYIVCVCVCELTFLRVAERPSEGSSHPRVSVLQVLQDHILHRDRLAVHLVTVAIVARHGPAQNQDLVEKEDVQLLHTQKHTHISLLTFS